MNLRFRELLSKQISSSQAAFQAQILQLLLATATEEQPAVAPLTAGPSNTVKDKTLKELMADFPKTFDGECRPI